MHANRQIAKITVICAVCVFFASLYCTADEEKTWGQVPPGSTPKKFAPDVVSTGDHEYACCFSLDGKSFYFSRNSETQQAIYVLQDEKDKLGKPELATFSGQGNFGDFEPDITPDGQKLIYQSWRPLPQGVEGSPPDIWYCQKTDQGWGEPQHFGPPFQPSTYMFSSVSDDGTMYSALMMEGEIVKSELVDGKYTEFEKLSAPINTEYSEQYPSVAPDGSYLIFNSDRPTPGVNSKLFISFRESDGSWGEPKPIPTGFEPSNMGIISRDGKYLFFTHYGDIYWVSSSILEQLVPKK